MPRNQPREHPLAVVLLRIDREDRNLHDLRYPNEDMRRKKKTKKRMILVSMIHLKRKRKTLGMNTMRK
jgi:hypothetical protein